MVSTSTALITYIYKILLHHCTTQYYNSNMKITQCKAQILGVILSNLFTVLGRNHLQVNSKSKSLFANLLN